MSLQGGGVLPIDLSINAQNRVLITVGLGAVITTNRLAGNKKSSLGSSSSSSSSGKGLAGGEEVVVVAAASVEEAGAEAAGSMMIDLGRKKGLRRSRSRREAMRGPGAMQTGGECWQAYFLYVEHSLGVGFHGEQWLCGGWSLWKCSCRLL